MTMDINNSGDKGALPPGRAPDPSRPRPEWADGLRKLYDSVVEEPLPDSFRDLLDKLDKNT